MRRDRKPATADIQGIVQVWSVNHEAAIVELPEVPGRPGVELHVWIRDSGALAYWALDDGQLLWVPVVGRC